MKQWKASPATLFLLGGLIALMLLIVILPDDVDLPDAAFHRGTAPVMVNSSANAAPVVAAFAATFTAPILGSAQHLPNWQPRSELDAVPNFRPIFLRNIRC